MDRIRAWWRNLSRRAKIVVSVVVVFLAFAAIGAVSRDPAGDKTATASPSAAAATAPSVVTATASVVPSAEATPEPSAEPTSAVTAEPTAEVTPEPTPAVTLAPVAKPIVLKGSGTRKTKPFTMVSPATVDLTFTGSGNFISNITPVGGGVFDGVNLSNTIGRTKLRTFVYGDELDGVRSYADVLASTGSWTITITPGVPSAVSAPASFSGRWGLRTRLVELAGDYTVTFSHSGSGNFIVQLIPPGGSVFDGESVANEIGKVKDSTEVYGLDGDYYFDVTANGAWTMSIKLQ